ncbi:MAG TPA: hypothetical protein PKC27_03255, partial [Methanomethylovorans sp.]|nr:hypothetical protein [Methanomethylovorans sp.]
MKKLFTLSVGLVVLLLMAASASAASDSKTTETVKTGVAYWSIPNDYGSMCVDLEVDMYSDDTAEVYFYA